MSELSNKKVTRRQVLKAAGAATVFAGTGNTFAQQPDKSQVTRKIKLGVIGCGGRGGWIANFFKEHGGYQMHAVADYFQHVADKCGDKLGVNSGRRFSGLSGYKKLIDSGVEAVALETPPYFFPEHAAAAVEAGLHVYMAKPVAVDVPGSMTILDAGKKSTKNKRVFFVDYQIPTDPINIKVAKAIHDGHIGPIAQVATFGVGGGFADPPKTKNIESRLQKLIWVNDIALGCDYIGNYDIHAIDAALWAIGQRPVAASGSSRICRANPHGDARDVCSVVFKYANGVVHNHFGQALKNNTDGRLSCHVYGQTANALINYWGKSYVRGGKGHCAGETKSLYSAGAKRNITAFYNNVIEEDFSNDTLQRSVDGVLATILGREAAARGTGLTMDELIKENKRLEVDLSGLKS
jgi:myo-inositol 2-dehydrogenase/D-chiro-inositol 1-dehydrogenase